MNASLNRFQLITTESTDESEPDSVIEEYEPPDDTPTKVVLIKEMFPSIDDDEIIYLLGLVNGNKNQVVTLCLDGLNMKCLLRVFKAMKMDTRVKRIRVDPDDILSDGLAAYKSPKLCVNRPLEVDFIGSHAVDLGGPRRQFFSTLLHELATNPRLRLFEGDYNGANLLPSVNHDAIISGTFKLVGKIILHSILMEGPGFPLLPLPIYHYMITGSVTAALPHLNVAHLPLRAKVVVDQVTA